MVAGITIFNDKNSIQIDNRFNTYGLNSKQVVSNIQYLPTGINVLSPVVVGNPIRFISFTQSTDIEVFNFTSINSTYENLGLQVFKSDASVAFHSGAKPLKVIDFFRKDVRNSYGSPDVSSVIRKYPGYSRLGIVMSNRVPIFSKTDGLWRIYMPKITIHANGDIYFEFESSDSPVQNLNITTSGFNDFIVADLTNY